jgi:hypothetical protein
LTVTAPGGFIVPFDPAEAVIMFVSIAKFAVTVMVLSRSLREADVTPSFHDTKWYPVFATAVTGVPGVPYATV